MVSPTHLLVGQYFEDRPIGGSAADVQMCDGSAKSAILLPATDRPSRHPATLGHGALAMATRLPVASARDTAD
jgi:hypothetical protein